MVNLLGMLLQLWWLSSKEAFNPLNLSDDWELGKQIVELRLLQRGRL